MFIYLVLSSPTGSSDPPETPGPGYVSFRSCSGRGLHGSACYQTDGSLLHCLSTLTPAINPGYLGLLTRYLSVALSLELPPPDVIRRPALWSPDFPHLAPFGLPAANICFTCVFQYNTGIFPVQVPISAVTLFFSKVS